MNRWIDKILWKSGLKGPIPSPPDRSGMNGPYGHFYDMPRHQPTTALLLDQEIEVPDGPSFFWMHREIFYDQIYNFKPINDTPHIIDCGSNCGVSVIWFKATYPGSTVVSVEADPAIFSLLERNVARYGFSGVRLLQRAVAGGSGSVAFHCLGADCGSVQPRAEAGAAAEQAGGLQPAEAAVVNVPCITLDALIDRPTDFLKIDIEGSELEALAACRQLSLVRQLFLEFHSFPDRPQGLAQLLAILEAQGFRYYIQSVYGPKQPYRERPLNMGMDLQLNIHALRPGPALQVPSRSGS
jgi:FkbM family methyltransferase